MSVRRLLPLLALMALLFAPFGRIAAAETTMSHHQPVATAAGTAAHCADMPMPADGADDKRAINCMIACAVITQPEGSVLVAAPRPALPPARVAQPIFSGLHPEAEPPPPRSS